MKPKELAKALRVSPGLMSDICAELNVEASRELTTREIIVIVEFAMIKLDELEEEKGKTDGVAN